MKKADTLAVDNQLDYLGTMQTRLSHEMASAVNGPTQAQINTMTDICGKIAELKFQREEIIRQTFYRSGR